MISNLLGTIGTPVGGFFGNPPLSSQIGGLGGLLPFRAGPQFAPQGFWNDVFGTTGRMLPFPIGLPFAPQAFWGETPGTVIPGLLPFQAGPQLAPQGLLGSLFGTIGAPVGGAIGNLFGNPQLGGQIGSAVGGVSGLMPFQASPELETQAFNRFMETQSSDLVRKLYDYLSMHSPQHSELGECISLVGQAAQSFGARDYAQAFAQAYQAYRCITLLRARIPELPAL
jgi:hypothetical protein